jgi:hypothetical protein
MIEEMPAHVVAHLDTTLVQLRQHLATSDIRPLRQPGADPAASFANANGFLPPIGSAAGLPVSSVRFVHRIAEEWLTLNQRAAARLIPPATAATTRSLSSTE